MIKGYFLPRVALNKMSRGLTLVELSISIAISALLIVMFLEARVKDLRQAQILFEAGWVSSLINEIPQGLSNAPDFSGVSMPYVAGMNSLPKSFVSTVSGAKVVANGAGGRIYAAGRDYGTQANQALALTYTNVPVELCSNLIAALESISNQRGTPLSAILGSQSVLTAAPALTWDPTTNALTAGSKDEVVLKKSPNDQLDVANLAGFCGARANLKSVTLVRLRAR